MLSQSELITEIKAEGSVKNIRNVAISTKETASGSLFFLGESVQNGDPLFLKLYRPPFAHYAAVEKEYTERFADTLREHRAQVAATIPIYKILTLSDGTTVMVMKRVKGETLAILVRKGEKLSPENSDVIRKGFLEIAEALKKKDFLHRDICLKNLMLVENTLVFFDFQTAIEYASPVYRNPSFWFLRNILGLGATYKGERAHWNDAYSLFRTYEQTLPVLTLDTATAQADLESIYAVSESLPGVRAYFTADDAWKRANRWAYWKLRLRPGWTRKRSSRMKNAVVMNCIRQLYRAKSGDRVPGPPDGNVKK